MISRLFPLIGLGVLYFALHAQAQENKYVTAMKAAIASLDQANGPLEWQNSANKFEQIAQVKSNEWLPNYWVAYSTLMINFMQEENTKKDEYIDKAEAFLDKAAALAKDHSEILVLRAYIAMARLAVDGQGRWQTQMPLFNQALGQAEKSDPKNPRIDYLRGTNLFHTPESFGGGKDVACPILQNALKKFEGFRPESEIAPNWGKSSLESFTRQCEQ